MLETFSTSMQQLLGVQTNILSWLGMNLLQTCLDIMKQWIVSRSAREWLKYLIWGQNELQIFFTKCPVPVFINSRYSVFQLDSPNSAYCYKWVICNFREMLFPVKACKYIYLLKQTSDMVGFSPAFSKFSHP